MSSVMVDSAGPTRRRVSCRVESNTPAPPPRSHSHPMSRRFQRELSKLTEASTDLADKTVALEELEAVVERERESAKQLGKQARGCTSKCFTRCTRRRRVCARTAVNTLTRPRVAAAYQQSAVANGSDGLK